MQTNPYSDIPGFRPYMVTSTSQLKKILIREGTPFRCNHCLTTTWQAQPVPLQINHIDGDRSNNLRGNLELICPNCHALTDTYCGKNAKNIRRITDQQILDAYAEVTRERGSASANAILTRLKGKTSKPQRERITQLCTNAGLPLVTYVPRFHNKTKIKWPSDQALKTLLEAHPRTKVASMLGVSDTAVKKRCSSRNIALEPKKQLRRVKPKTVNNTTRPTPTERLRSLHGTRAGYLLEGRLKLPRCAECKAANSRYTQDLKTRTKKAEASP